MKKSKIKLVSSADPSKFKIGASSARRLAAMSEGQAEQFLGLTLAEVAEKFRYIIDPKLFMFRKVCGTVVKTDPTTGIDYPVPFATVNVEDTDCSLLGFFPSTRVWSWFFPFHCHREVIATAVTNECGQFCVWIPRWDIDWVLRFRRERHCFPTIFERPSLRDLINDLIPREIPHFPPGPGPDPAPFIDFDRSHLVARVEQSLGRNIALRINRAQSQVGFGASTVGLNAMLDAPAALPNMQPPLPPELKKLRSVPTGTGRDNGVTDTLAPAVHTLASHLNLYAQDLKGLDLRRYIGPFKRCVDVLVPEWTPIMDVPDITFSVMQDTNGDGVEEQIYGEGFFLVRWDANIIGPVTIHAGPNARAGVMCGPDSIPCGNAPAIVMAGRLPVTGDPSVYDSANGYAVRTNRPHPSGLFTDPLPLTNAAASPLAGVLSLYGCNGTDPNATHYRLRYKYSNDDGASYTSFAPFVGLTWPLYRLNGVGIGEWYYPPVDPAGWYPIALPPGPHPWLPQALLIDWPSYNFANGRYVVKLELGTGGVVSSNSADVAFNVDNSAPLGPMTVEWSFWPSGPFTAIDGICPVVRRHATPVDLYFRVTLDAQARHLRSANMWASGCGAGNFAFVSGSGGAPIVSGGTLYYQHWHDSVADNSQVLQMVCLLASTAAEGTYSFGAHVSSRAFSPSGYDGGHLAVPSWQYDPEHIYIDPSVAFSVFNSN
jgi:hypothetical protein